MKYLKCLELQQPDPEVIKELLAGSIDMHIHFGPDKKPRRDAMQVAMAAQEAGMRGVVLKSTSFPTNPVAAVTKYVAPDVQCFGSVTLDYEVTGGINEYTPLLLENQAKQGAKVLWMPAFSAAYARKFIPGKEGTGICIIDQDGNLIPEIIPLLEIVKKYDMVLATAHISYEEADALLTKAHEMGIQKMIVTHPFSDVIWDPMTLEQTLHLVSLGAYAEFCYLSCTPMNGREDPEFYLNMMRAIGPEHCIMSTDMAQITDPVPAEGMRQYIAHMLQYGATKEEVEWMVKKNPAKLLSLDE